MREAAARGARLVLLPELFENLYWCQVQRESFFASAHPLDTHPFLSALLRARTGARRGAAAKLLRAERAGALQQPGDDRRQRRNPGRLPQVAHPGRPRYQEKYDFNPGDTGFKAFPTGAGTVGAAICWDQWYPESARAMTLQGAEVLLYPTAIGSEPEEAGAIDTSVLWRRAMIGHAVSNSCYLAAANRVGTERIEDHEQTYYGTSFIADYQGEILAEANRTDEAVLVATLDLDAARSFRAGMGFFRDRRPDLYAPLTTYDGQTQKK